MTFCFCSISISLAAHDDVFFFSGTPAGTGGRLRIRGEFPRQLRPPSPKGQINSENTHKQKEGKRGRNSLRRKEAELDFLTCRGHTHTHGEGQQLNGGLK